MASGSEYVSFGAFTKALGDLVHAAAANGVRWSRRQHGKDKLVLANGERQAVVYVVESGWGSIDRNFADGSRQIVGFALPTDLIDLRHGDTPLRESFRAITPLSLYELHVADLREALARSTSFANAYLRASQRRQAISIEHLVNCGARSATQSVAHLLLEFSIRAGDPAGDRYDCPLTQFDVADALGLTPVHLNRTLRKLRDLELVEFRHGWVRIINRDGLVQHAGFSPAYLFDVLM